ncbi:hypothetical protein QSJ18_01870 [Gordonia sp. ABSL1-1]|uniref:hypothetical protein n=1 Tax=Gordonia sp. ABSL1-1 TaxID=3053923 RepID=UPI00257428A5|nr:hypothetical protein [Gordonia sp. ABSL1-1]MDL9935484.1 hypothetical protein [Gordonia sp. ABSL1-1]
MNRENFLDEASAAYSAGELTGVNAALREHPRAQRGLDNRLTMSEPSPGEYRNRFSYILSNSADLQPKPLQRNGFSDDHLRDDYRERHGGLELASAEDAYDARIEAMLGSGRPAHAVQVYDREHFRNELDEPLDYDESIRHATGVMTWPVTMEWSALRMILRLIHWDSMECWWCGNVKGRISEVEGHQTFVPVHSLGVTRVYPTCTKCLGRFNADIEGGVRVITVSDMLRLRNTGWPADRFREGEL